jgi:hypothetical protein
VTAPSPQEIVIEICGEGRTDVAQNGATPVPADSGVVPILTRRLCNNPAALRVKRTQYMFLQGKKKRWQKVRFFKRNAKINGSAGCVFVLDSEGDFPSVQAELEQGRSHESGDYPMAIGVAHPYIEAWLLTDASALRRGLGLNQKPTVPSEPETLPAPQANRKNNPKTALAECHPNNRHPNLAEKSAIAEQISLDTAATICPSFAAFAAEVRRHIRPLFASPPAIDEAASDPVAPPQIPNSE